MSIAKPAVNPEFQKCIDIAGSQRNLARWLGYAQQSINNVARGRDKISFKMALKISKFFKNRVNIDKLMPDY